MSQACPLCRESFAAHLAVRARSRAKWRGASFDAAAAKANAGLAVMDALGWSARDAEAVRRFQARVRVEAFRETAGADLNPPERFDPEVGEWWEFHVGFREAPDADVLARAERGVVDAIARSRNYSDAEKVPANVP